MSFAFEPAPQRLDEVLDPQWLTAMFATRWPDAVVRKVTVVETLVTMATKVRLALEVDGAGPDLPRNICIKGVLTDTGLRSSASVVETLFYREWAEQLPVRVPRCIYARLNAAGDNGVIVMQDVIEQGGRFLSALTAFTPEDARGSLEQLALLNARGWQGQPLYDTPWIPRFLDTLSAQPIMPVETLQALLNDPRGEHLPAHIRDAARLQKGLESLAAQVRERPACIVHGDAHAGNIYRNADGFGLVDWQVLQKGEWAQDVAYHLAAVLSPEDRRAHERDLLDYYRDRLKQAGGPDLDAEESWTRYRAAMVYGYYLWAITRKVTPEITHEFVRRLGLAVHDLDSFAAAGL